MRHSLLLFVLVTVSAVPAVASDFTLHAGEIGPIVISTQVNVRNAKEELKAFPKKVAEFTASARNDSGLPIRYARFCVQTGRRGKGCDFEFWTNGVWMPGEELLWMLDKRAKPGMEKPTSVTLLKFRAVKNQQQ